MLPPCVLWVDPGGMTGLAWLYATGTGFHAMEQPFAAAGASIEATCCQYGPGLFLGWEHYWIDPSRPQTDAASAIEMIGVCRWLATRHGSRLLTPAQPKDRLVATRAMVEAAGWWVKGKNDAQSAAQHMMAWCLRTGNLPPDVAGKLSQAADTL